MDQTFDTILKKAKEALNNAADAQAAEAVWREYAGKRGVFREQLRTIGSSPASERSRIGQTLHNALATFEEFAQRRLRELRQEEERYVLRHERIDVTRPVRVRQGTLHPLTKVRRDAERIFLSMGFSIVEGPEVEDEWHNFDALNIPANHPARDLWDTFWLKAQNDAERHAEGRRKIPRKSASSLRQSVAKQKFLLRTHTSPVQVRFMETHNPPFRIIVPGQAFRYEATDASHENQFMQIEGLMVDRKDAQAPITMATLISVLTTFFQKFFGKPVALRVRPSFFPFVEPGIEIDLSCIICGGKGCVVCQQTGWLEMLGAGMVHPRVFDLVGYNPKHVQGFAFGLGIERLAMLKYRIPDVRLFRAGDIRFLKQFK